MTVIEHTTAVPVQRPARRGQTAASRTAGIATGLLVLAAATGTVTLAGWIMTRALVWAWQHAVVEVVMSRFAIGQ
jgi:hypothetical protein